MFVQRRIFATVRDRLAKRPVVVLFGPRQVGKTTSAREIAPSSSTPPIYLDLERPADAARLTDADSFLRARPNDFIVVDEVQRAPALFPLLRGVVDERIRLKASGAFLLLGSAALDLSRQASESLAGRVSYLELAPIDVLEAGAAEITPETLWTRGGFPASLLAASDEESLQWRDDFVKSYVERDIPAFAPRLPAQTIRRLWTMLAHAQGTTLQISRLAASLGVSATALGRYLDLLCDLLLMRRLSPWSGNIGKRLMKSPKIYVRDSGIAHGLLGIESLYDLLGHPVCGASWEGFVIENCLAVAGGRREAFFYRTEDGAEIDLVFERHGVVEMAIEIKRSSAPALSRGFHSACEALRPKERYCVHGGAESWLMLGGVTAMSLTSMLELLKE